MKKFRHLNVPSHWEHYWSKYPEGYTILEALLNWVRQVDDMVDNVNDWNKYLENFVETFDEKLRPHVRDFMKELEENGRLAEIINDEIFTDINNSISELTDTVETHGENIEVLKNSTGVSVDSFPRFSDENDDMPRFQRAVHSLNVGDTLIIPGKETPYVFKFKPYSTINTPTRIDILKDNISIIGIGKPVINMTGLTLQYLFGIDDYASSGRDIFTCFSFQGVKKPTIKNIHFVGEYDGLTPFRYQSPRAIGVAFKGTTQALAEEVTGNYIMGNVINATNSYEDYDVPYKECIDTEFIKGRAENCMENGYNLMGGTTNSKVSFLTGYGNANGLESASKGLVVSDCIFKFNRGSGVGLSGENQFLNNVVAEGSSGEVNKQNGYGLIVTGAIGTGGVTVVGGSFSNNVSNGVMLYPGVKKVKMTGVQIENNSNVNGYKTNVYVVGSPGNKIEDVVFSDCRISSIHDVQGAQISNADKVSFISCDGHSNSGLALNFTNTCTDSKAILNRFNRPVNMSDATGHIYNNGMYRTVERTTIPTTGIWKLNDRVINTSPGIGGWLEAVCVQAGEFGVGNPLFQVSKQNGYVNSISVVPQYVGQMALTLGSSPALYVSTGTTSTDDWFKVG